MIRWLTNRWRELKRLWAPMPGKPTLESMSRRRWHLLSLKERAARHRRA